MMVCGFGFDRITGYAQAEVGTDLLGEWHKLMHGSRKAKRRDWESETNLVWLEHSVNMERLGRGGICMFIGT